MKVRVVGTYQVVHEGKQYLEGDEIDAPDGDAQQWVTAGIAEPVKSGAKAQDSADNKAQDSAANKAATSRSSDKK